ncbi:NADPH-dependent FMN reductase [Actinosynnema sp. NPDC059797]
MIDIESRGKSAPDRRSVSHHDLSALCEARFACSIERGGRVPGELTVLGIGGSLGARSRTAALLRTALRHCRDHGMRPRLYDLNKHRLPLFEPTAEAGPPASAALLLSEVRAADAIVFASPTYHGTVSGALKNAIDYLQLLASDDPPWLSGKSVALMTASSGQGAGMQTITALDHACRAMRAVTVPTVVVATDEDFARTAALADDRFTARFERIVAELRRHAGTVRAEALVDAP